MAVTDKSTYFDVRKDYSPFDYLVEFLVEAFEILILYTLYHVIISDVKFDTIKSVKIALLVSAFSNLLEWYNPVLRNQMKTGMLSNVGAAFIKFK